MFLSRKKTGLFLLLFILIGVLYLVRYVSVNELGEEAGAVVPEEEVGDVEKVEKVEEEVLEGDDVVSEDVVVRGEGDDVDLSLPLSLSSGLSVTDEVVQNLPILKKVVVAAVDGGSTLRRGVNNRLLLPEAVVSERHADVGAVSGEVVFSANAGAVMGELTMDEHTLSAIEVSMDVEAMENFVSSDDGAVRIPVAGGKDLLVFIDRVVTRGEHTKTLIGSVVGEAGSDVIIVFHDGAVSGSIALHGENVHYQLVSAGNGDVAVRKLDMHSFEGGCAGCSHGEVNIEDDEGSEDLVVEEDGEILEAPAGFTPFDTVVGYSREARESDGGTANIEARIVQSVDRMNMALGNSNSGDWYCSLLAMIEEPDGTFSDSNYSDMSEMLIDLRQTTDGVLDAVTDLQSELGADHASFICDNTISGTAGIAYRPGTTMVVSRTYMTSARLTFCHEMGHSLGLRHAWGDSGTSSSNPKDQRNYGWRFDPPNGGKVRTIMAYNGGWGGSRIPYFSNPNVNYNGAPTGAARGFDATDTSGIPAYDQQLVSGGSIGGLGSGYDGSNTNLGAGNGLYLIYNSGLLANKDTREALAVLEPAGGVNLLPGETQTIFWYGGDHSDTVTIDLLKGGVFHSAIASGISGEERWYDWSVPNVPYGSNYKIRVTLNGSSSDASDAFTIGVPVAMLPYAESFESGMGAWIQVTDDDYDWTVNSGGTSTAAAGPSGASDGSGYLYAEGHDSGAPHSSASVQAVFDFSGVGSAEFSFDYHMYGAYIDYLALDVYDGTSWSVDVWRQDGQAQSGSGDTWKGAKVDLSAYAGNSEVTLRFTTKHKLWYAADPAIDNLVLGEVPPTPFEIWSGVVFTGAPQGTDVSETGDPDRDGVSNELEYLLGTDPLAADSAIKMILVEPRLMSFDYTRRKVDGFSIYAQWSAGLATEDWGITGLKEEVTADDGEVETVRGTVPVGLDEEKKFIRIRAEEE